MRWYGEKKTEQKWISCIKQWITICSDVSAERFDWNHNPVQMRVFVETKCFLNRVQWKWSRNVKIFQLLTVYGRVLRKLQKCAWNSPKSVTWINHNNAQWNLYKILKNKIFRIIVQTFKHTQTKAKIAACWKICYFYVASYASLFTEANKWKKHCFAMLHSTANVHIVMSVLMEKYNVWSTWPDNVTFEGRKGINRVVFTHSQ